ncbi:MAG: hypothetical protein ACKN86_04495, partial [Crocinitomicaceae bacterium]
WQIFSISIFISSLSPDSSRYSNFRSLQKLLIDSLFLEDNTMKLQQILNGSKLINRRALDPVPEINRAILGEFMGLQS